MHQAELLLDAKAVLGEGPIWGNSGLYWIDILAPRLEVVDTSNNRRIIPLPEEGPVACVAFATGDRLLVTLRDSVWLMNDDGSEPELVTRLPVPNDMRLNDGAVDPDGRFWIGSLHDVDHGRGELYRVDHEWQSFLSGVSISNGIDWSLSGDLMYYVDSMTRRVEVFDFEDGYISERRMFVEIAPDDGFPDGLTVDALGNVWVALWDGWGVWAFDPAGRNIDRVSLPCSQVTSCAFGGDDYERLYITSARDGLSDERLVDEPLAGGLFVSDVGVKGRPSNLFMA